MSLGPAVSPRVLACFELPPLPLFDFTFLFHYIEIFALDSEEYYQGYLFDSLFLFISDHTFPNHNLRVLARYDNLRPESNFFLAFPKASCKYSLAWLKVTTWKYPFISKGHPFMPLSSQYFPCVFVLNEDNHTWRNPSILVFQ